MEGPADGACCFIARLEAPTWQCACACPSLHGFFRHTTSQVKERHIFLQKGTWFGELSNCSCIFTTYYLSLQQKLALQQLESTTQANGPKQLAVSKTPDLAKWCMSHVLNRLEPSDASSNSAYKHSIDTMCMAAQEHMQASTLAKG